MDIKQSPTQNMAASEVYYDLGKYHRPVQTSSPDAQIWFNRGLIWCYGFNHEEAVECFEHAIADDSSCAMAYWGLAYALGPNYNKPWEFYDGDELETLLLQTHKAASQAKARAATSTPVEQALIEALQYRFPAHHAGLDFTKWNERYAEAMKTAYTAFPTDIDVAVLYADALMNLTAWKLWDLRSGQPAKGARTLEAKRVLDIAFTQPHSSLHPGLNHLYIHLMEMSSTPEAALPAADNLRSLVPDSGHLNHMPSHIDVLCGDYASVITSNSAAILADQKYLSRAGPLNFYTLYRSHNYHFRLYGAMFAGQSRIALDTAMQLEASIPEKLLRDRTSQSSPLANWLEAFVAVKVHVYIRFGHWRTLIALPLPKDQKLYCVTTAMIHYGKAIAHAAIGELKEGYAERERFYAAVSRVPKTRTLFNNTCLDLLNIASALLDGELAYRAGDFDTAFTHLERSTHLDENLPYDEPWGWMQPTRHAYGALLLEQGRVEDARAVYAADLGVDDTLPRALRHPGNVWSLAGYYECLVRLGREEEAKKIEPELRRAEKGADVPIRSSCFCRLGRAKI